MRKLLMGLFVAVLFITGTGSAQAVPAGEDFALACDANSIARGRVDMDNVYITQLGAKVDADDIWYRSLNHSNQQQTWDAAAVRIQLFDKRANDGAGAWVVWTTRGGTATDSGTVPQSYHWDPSAKYNENANYTKIRMQFWYASGQSCSSPVRTV